MGGWEHKEMEHKASLGQGSAAEEHRACLGQQSSSVWLGSCHAQGQSVGDHQCRGALRPQGTGEPGMALGKGIVGLDVQFTEITMETVPRITINSLPGLFGMNVFHPSENPRW